MEECTEPGCRYPATEDYHGKKVCKDCFEKYKEKERKLNQSLQEDW